MNSPKSSAPRAAVAFILVLVLVASSCGGSKKTTSDEKKDGEDVTSERDEEGAADVTIEPSGDPVSGGTLVFGLEAETDGWDPTKNRWAVSGNIVGHAVFDSLAEWTADLEAVPYLAESIVPNEDFTEWVITLREGVTFHNGDPLTAEAVKQTMDAHLASGLTAPTLRPVQSIEVVDDLTVKVVMSTPWASFPVVLTSQIGVVPAPAQLTSDDSAQRPIGTGPFAFEQWTPDNKWVGSRYAGYWREGLPYLDEVEFRPIPEVQTRVPSIETGDIDMTHTSDDETIVIYRDKANAGDVQMIEDGGNSEEVFVMLNTAVPPLDDLEVRQALAYATDKQSYIEVAGSGILVAANGPFDPSSPWYDPAVEDTYPQYDPDKARELVDAYEAENGPIEFSLGTTNVQSNITAVQLIQSQWKDIGIDVETKTSEQGQFIIDALNGNFEANLWRQFGSPDPDGDSVWWDSENAKPVGEVSLNFARNKDPDIDAALDAGRSTQDVDARKADYDTVQERLDTDIPYIWLTHTLWALIADNSVRNVGYVTLPDGQEGLGFYNGQVRLTETWLEE
jgi:ABC-type transport system substrate-binding protein